MKEIDLIFFSLLQVSCRVRRALARTEESACHRCAASRIASEWTHFVLINYLSAFIFINYGLRTILREIRRHELLRVVIRFWSAFEEGGRKRIEGMEDGEGWKRIGCFAASHAKRTVRGGNLSEERRSLEERRGKRIKKFGICLVDAFFRILYYYLSYDICIFLS